MVIRYLDSDRVFTAVSKLSRPEFSEPGGGAVTLGEDVSPRTLRCRVMDYIISLLPDRYILCTLAPSVATGIAPE
jgi:hypothetical protein